MIPKKWTPHDYQVTGVKHLISPTGGGIFAKPGRGKTTMMLAALKVLKNKGLIRKTLVLAPLRVVQLTWPEEIEQWLDFCDMTYTVLHGTTKNELLKRDTDIYLLNYEGLDWLLPLINTGKAPKFDVLVVDESSKMRNTASKRFKALKRVLPKFSRRYILTGSPQPKSLLNLFGQLYIADLGSSLGKYITKFRTEFFYQMPENDYDYFPFPDTEQKIYSRIQHRIFHYSDDKDTNAAPIDIPVLLDAKSRATYKTMEREFFAMVQDKELSAANAAVASGKLRQICNGFLYTKDVPDCEDYVVVNDAKIQAFKDLVDELAGAPAIVVYQFEADYERLNDARPGVKFTGTKDAVGLKERWDAGDITLLYLHPQSAGFGLNMQHGGCIMIWFGLTFNYEDYYQTIKRIDRQGQTRQVQNYRLVAKDTIEDRVMTKVLAEREEGQERLFDHLNDYWAMKVLNKE